jgi:tetratricopeptide (TPR) repeat protein
MKKERYKITPILVTAFAVLVFGTVRHVHAVASGSFGYEKEYLEGVSLYNSEDYSKAAELFENIAGNHVVNGELFYNLGNAYFKKGDLGKSVLWYERAIKLIPGDPDLVFNHHYVTGLVTDKAEVKTNPILNVLMFWKRGMSERAVSFTAVGLFMVFTVIAAIRSFKPKRFLKYPERITLAFALLFIMSSAHDYYTNRFDGEAVVIADTISVRSGLSEDSTELFRLHAGTKVHIDDVLREYAKIRFSDEKIGWALKSEIEAIRI